jgi:hypothetical protein
MSKPRGARWPLRPEREMDTTVSSLKNRRRGRVAAATPWEPGWRGNLGLGPLTALQEMRRERPMGDEDEEAGLVVGRRAAVVLPTPHGRDDPQFVSLAAAVGGEHRFTTVVERTAAVAAALDGAPEIWRCFPIACASPHSLPLFSAEQAQRRGSPLRKFLRSSWTPFACSVS